MAESFAFNIAAQILGKLTTLAIREIGLIWGVKSDLKKLELTLSSIKPVLLDAAEKKKKSQHIADWLEKLHEVLDDADDLLDDFMTEELLLKVVVKESKRKAVKNFFSSSNSLALRVKMSHKLQKIQSDLEEIYADMKRFEFVECVLDNPVAYPQIREQTHSFIRASQVSGRDGDKNRIIKLLLRSSSSSGSSSTSVEKISVLPIVGLGGLGKTTLAKLVYNDNATASKFAIKLWICVSDDFDLKKLIEKIMKETTGGVDHAHLDLNQLQSRLCTTLQSKKFLLVLDDVRTEDLKTWMELKELLHYGSRGSTVIVTTRNRKTAEIMGTLSTYELKGLTDDECMSIFLTCAFKEGEEERYQNLLEIGKEIVMKCSGLPLAVKSLGRLLFTKREKREWVSVRDTDIWEIEQEENDVLPILKLSYDDLPLHLKQCFAFCATYPKNSIIHQLDLVRRWMMAHGLLKSCDKGLDLEDIGNQYFHELLSGPSSKMSDQISTVRYLKLKLGTISNTFFDTLIKTFSCLRILHLYGSEFEELPSSIGMLKHLRYLNLGRNRNIKRLPDNMCNLVNS